MILGAAGERRYPGIPLQGRPLCSPVSSQTTLPQKVVETVPSRARLLNGPSANKCVADSVPRAESFNVSLPPKPHDGKKTHSSLNSTRVKVGPLTGSKLSSPLPSCKESEPFSALVTMTPFSLPS